MRADVAGGPRERNVIGGLAAHEAIAGSTHTTMTGLGHFPMQENPEMFLRSLLPILDEIRGAG